MRCISSLIIELKHIRDPLVKLASLFKETLIKIDEKGLILGSIDDSRISMFKMEIEKEAFSKFNVEEPVELTIDLSDFKKILKRGQKKSLMAINATSDNIEVAFMKTLYSYEDERKFILPTIDDEIKLLNIDIEATVKIEIDDSKILKDSINDAATISDTITLETVEEDEPKFLIKAQNDFGLRYVREIILGREPGVIMYEMAHGEHSSYSIDYLKKLIVKSEATIIEFKKEGPLLLKHYYPNVSLLTVLAPVVM